MLRYIIKFTSSEKPMVIAAPMKKLESAIVLPNIMSGIITGLVMSFTLSLDDFIISYFTNGPSFQTLPIYIFSLTKKRVKPDMYALSMLMFIVILVLLILLNVAQNKAEKGKRDKK